MSSLLGKSRSNSRVLFYAGCEDVYNHQQPLYFLESCFLCHKPLTTSHDIFMYRGNTPFCSEQCREEQIQRDEAIATSLRALRKTSAEIPSNNNNNNKNKSGSSAKSVHTATTTIVVA